MPKHFFNIAILLGVLALPAGFFGWLSDRTENSRAEIARTEECLDAMKTVVDALVLTRDLANPGKHSGRFILDSTHRAALEECLAHLTSRNESIGKAKFLAQTGVLVDRWDRFYPAGANPWVEKDWAEKEWRTSYGEATGIALLSAAGTFTVTLLGLLILRWSWCFFLDRIRELSKAIRGQ